MHAIEEQNGTEQIQIQIPMGLVTRGTASSWDGQHTGAERSREEHRVQELVNRNYFMLIRLKQMDLLKLYVKRLGMLLLLLAPVLRVLRVRIHVDHLHVAAGETESETLISSRALKNGCQSFFAR